MIEAAWPAMDEGDRPRGDGRIKLMSYGSALRQSRCAPERLRQDVGQRALSPTSHRSPR